MDNWLMHPKLITLTHQELLRRITYDKETGIFTHNSRIVTGARDTGWNTQHAGKQAGYKMAEGYISITLDNKSYMAHRLAWFYVAQAWPKLLIDHINNIRDDNRIINLREADYDQNAHNHKLYRHNKSGHSGVWWDKNSDCWVAQLHGKEGRYLGWFKSKDDAISCRQAAEQYYYGDFNSHYDTNT